MRKLKSRLIIDFEVEPSERFKTMMDEDGKQIRESYCTKIARACINATQTRIYQYIESNIMDEQDEIAYDAAEDAGIDTDTIDGGFNDLVKSFQIRMESKQIKFSDVNLIPHPSSN